MTIKIPKSVYDRIKQMKSDVYSFYNLNYNEDNTIEFIGPYGNIYLQSTPDEDFTHVVTKQVMEYKNE